jgi:2-keto-4-pentenoate hydratase
MLMNSKFDVATSAAALVAARRDRRALSDFPGPVPPDLATAYAVQDAAIAGLGGAVVGWKVAAVAPAFRDRFDVPRLSGPVMAGTVMMADGEKPVEITPIAGGFAALEAEFVLRMGRDLPARPAPYTEAEVAAAVATMHGGVEFAGFPLKTINDLGPGAIIACYGNNAGIIIGPAIADWQKRPLESLGTRVEIDGREVGRGSAAKVAGGPLSALLFLVNHLSERGRGLKAGDWVSSGASTGVHDVVPGNVARLIFEGVGTIVVKVG